MNYGARMRTANPVLSEKTFSDVRGHATEGGMSVQGTVNKTAILLVLLLASSSFVWSRAFAGAPVYGLLMLGAIGGLVVAMITIYQKTWAPVTAPLYALLEGVAIGAISAIYEATYPGS